MRRECAIISHLAQGVSFFLLAEHCWTGLYYNHKQIQIEHDTLASACFRFLVFIALLCRFFFLHLCLYETEQRGGGGSMETWKIKPHMMDAVIASETTEHIKSPLPSSHVLLPHPVSLMELLACLSWERGSWQKPQPLPEGRLPPVIWMCCDTMMETCGHISRERI